MLPGFVAPWAKRWCSTAFGARSRESNAKSTMRTRDSCGGITLLSVGADGSSRSRLQSPYAQVGSTSCVPEYEVITRFGAAALTTSSLSMVAGTREAFVSSRS